jgi:methylmalonyl-CoA/ethylmalonyl-CoA epimerase
MRVTESGTIHHVGIVVNDVEKSAAALDAAGIGPWAIWTITPESAAMGGKDVRFTFQVGFAAVGDSNFELIAPVDGESIYVDFLKTQGEGMHHTCIAYSSREALRAAKTELSRQGREIVQSADMGELGEFCYFEMPELGSLLELLYVSELPPPDLTVG